MEGESNNMTVPDETTVDALGVEIVNEVVVEDISCIFFSVDTLPRRWLIRIYSNRYPLTKIFIP